MSSDESEEMNCTPPELRAEAEVARNNLLPPKSKVRYMTAYENFIKWKEDKNAHSFSETVFLAYFAELAKTKKASTLWALYSMIKATVQLKHNINIKNYTNLVSWLKRQSDGYTAKKSKIFTCENVQNFLNNAPDETYLAIKVVLILGITGACRVMELYNLTTEDIEIHGDIILFKLCDTKTKFDRSFVIRDEFVNIFQKYHALRPDHVKSNKLFLKYINGKCTRQVIGRHTIAAMPHKIATFLNLENPVLYTGHCFRRSSATLLADSGANLLVVKRLGGWKSDKVAEGYIEDSVQNKENIAKHITKNILLQTDKAIRPIENKNNEPHQQYESLYTNPQPGPSNALPVFHEQPKSSIKITSKSTLSAPPVSSQVPVLNLQSSATSPQPPLTSPVNVSEQPTTTATTNVSSSQSITGSSSTNISVPGKTFNISITNCPNMSNITFNFQ